MSDFSKARTHVDHKQARLTTVHCLIFQLMLREFEDKENLGTGDGDGGGEDGEFPGFTLKLYLVD